MFFNLIKINIEDYELQRLKNSLVEGGGNVPNLELPGKLNILTDKKLEIK